MTTFPQVRDEMEQAVNDLSWQAQDVMESLVLPNWGSARKHGYSHILYGVVMNTMGLVDRLSTYQTVGTRMNQTQRLRQAYLEMGADHEAASVVVQMWRHTLMHTGMPVVLQATAVEINYYWNLQWGQPHMLKSQHMSLEEHPHGRVLNFGALFAVEDLVSLSQRFFASVAGQSGQETAVVQSHDRLARRQKVSIGRS